MLWYASLVFEVRALGYWTREKMLYHIRIDGGNVMVILTDQRIMLVSASAEADGLAPENIRMAGTHPCTRARARRKKRESPCLRHSRSGDFGLFVALFVPNASELKGVAMSSDISGVNQSSCGTIIEVQRVHDNQKLGIVRFFRSNPPSHWPHCQCSRACSALQRV